MVRQVKNGPPSGSINERYAAAAAAKLEKAKQLPPGRDREKLEREAREMQNASQINNWLSSGELESPT